MTDERNMLKRKQGGEGGREGGAEKNTVASALRPEGERTNPART